MREKIALILILVIFCVNNGFSSEFGTNLKVKPLPGEGAIDLLSRYGLTYSLNIDVFNNLNSGKFSRNGGIMLDFEYQLPIAVVKFNGRNIRTTLNISNFDTAKKIQDYNVDMHRKGVKAGDYRKDKILWVPFVEVGLHSGGQSIYSKSEIATNIAQATISPDAIFTPKPTTELFGDKNKVLRKTDSKLNKHFIYLIAGHGGPDPGAVGFRDGKVLHEHEYAYDITLRLAKRLVESGAEVFMIVQDPNDGIRDERYLGKSGSEFLINGDTISHVQVTRLKQRADLANELFRKNNISGNKHLLVEIHVDSRITDKRIDIFFYHQPGSVEGERFCNVLLHTIKEKYERSQPGRGYNGTVTARNLYTLRNTAMPGVYIELGNIQNPNDQIRIIEPSNRQAIANWLFDGILKAFDK